MILTAYLECILTDMRAIVDELHQLWHGFLTINSLAKGHPSTCGVTIDEIDA